MYLNQACSLLIPSSQVPGIGLGGLVPWSDCAVWGGLPSIVSEFLDCNAHGPRVKIDDLLFLWRYPSIAFLLSPLPVTAVQAS